MLKKILLVLVILVLLWFFFNNLQLFYFEVSKTKDPVFAKMYAEDTQILTDTLISWGDFDCSPLAGNPKTWWVDTMIYTPDKKRILALVDVLTSDSEHYNYSKWIYGIRESSGINFYACESSQMLVVLDKFLNNRGYVSHEGRLQLMNNLYYVFTFMERKNFWSYLFIENEQGIITIQKSLFKEYQNKTKN